MTYTRVLFTLPSVAGGVSHNNIFYDALNLDAVTFCNDVVAAVGTWYHANQANPNVQANLPRVDLIRFGGHLPKGGYDVQTNGRQSQAAAQAPAVRF
jgi:hypothetical protein